MKLSFVPRQGLFFLRESTLGVGQVQLALPLPRRSLLQLARLQFMIYTHTYISYIMHARAHTHTHTQTHDDTSAGARGLL